MAIFALPMMAIQAGYRVTMLQRVLSLPLE